MSIRVQDELDHIGAALSAESYSLSRFVNTEQLALSNRRGWLGTSGTFSVFENDMSAAYNASMGSL